MSGKPWAAGFRFASHAKRGRFGCRLCLDAAVPLATAIVLHALSLLVHTDAKCRLLGSP
jgi:hypothetical protein